MRLQEKKESSRKQNTLYRIEKLNRAVNLLLSVAYKAPDSEAESQWEEMRLRFMTELVMNCTDPRDIRFIVKPAWDCTDLRDMRFMAELVLNCTESWDIRIMTELALNHTDLGDIGLNSAYNKENYTEKEILQTMLMNMMNCCAHEWLQFDVFMHQHWVHIFVDSEASNCYLSKRIVNQLELEMKWTEKRSVIHLKEDKTILTLSFI